MFGYSFAVCGGHVADGYFVGFGGGEVDVVGAYSGYGDAVEDGVSVCGLVRDPVSIERDERGEYVSNVVWVISSRKEEYRTETGRNKYRRTALGWGKHRELQRR